MRYITHIDNLLLYLNNGHIAHRFGPYGTLIVGDPFTNVGNANRIHIHYGNVGLMHIFPTTLDGDDADPHIELCGLGSLTRLDWNGDVLPNLQDGYWRNFFEAPLIAAATPTISSVSGYADVYYQVIAGTVIYAGTTYTVGEQFYTDGLNTVITGTGLFALCIPPALTNKCECFRDEEFRLKHLKVGDEPADYYEFRDGGFDPRDSNDSTDADWYGWIR